LKHGAGRYVHYSTNCSTLEQISTSSCSLDYINHFEDFNKCITNDGEWHDDTDTCAVDISTFDFVANFDSKFITALEIYIDKNGDEQDAAYLVEYKEAMASFSAGSKDKAAKQA
jgi:hypothetical protein